MTPALASPAVHPQRGLAYAALALAGVLWGASFLFGKVALAEVSPAHLILYRFVLAAAVLGPLALTRRRPAITRADVAPLVGVSLLAVGMFWMQFEGLARTTASSAALLVGIGPPLLAVGALLYDGERPGRRTWGAVALSALGCVLLVSGPATGRTLLGDGLVLASMGAAVAWSLAARRLARRLGVLAATAFPFALGALVLLAVVLASGGPVVPVLSPAGAGSVLGLGIGCTALTFWLWNWGLLRAEAAKAGVFANLEPVIGAALGVVILGEFVGPLALAGAALVLMAAFVVGTDR